MQVCLRISKAILSKELQTFYCLIDVRSAAAFLNIFESVDPVKLLLHFPLSFCYFQMTSCWTNSKYFCHPALRNDYLLSECCPIIALKHSWQNALFKNERAMCCQVGCLSLLFHSQSHLNSGFSEISLMNHPSDITVVRITIAAFFHSASIQDMIF